MSWSVGMRNVAYLSSLGSSSSLLPHSVISKQTEGQTWLVQMLRETAQAPAPLPGSNLPQECSRPALPTLPLPSAWFIWKSCENADSELQSSEINSALKTTHNWDRRHLNEGRGFPKLTWVGYWVNWDFTWDWQTPSFHLTCLSSQNSNA